MLLKDVIDSPCGLRFMFDELDLQSGFSRRWLLDSPMMVDATDITQAYDMVQQFLHFIDTTDSLHTNTVLHKLMCLKDIRTSIRNLSHGATLDDIELFEVKHLSLLANDVARLMAQHGMEHSIEIPDLYEVIDALDPDGMRIATFHVYDAYDQRLKDLRIQMRQHPDQQEPLLLEASKIEEEVRCQLSQRLRPHATAIEKALVALALIDINVAKARQMRILGLCIPSIEPDATTSYHQMFHPQVKASLTAKGKKFQPVDITFDHRPTLITGANMGGKTVVLKTLTLCQYLMQFGFGIPAQEASIAVVDEVYFCIGDDQSVERGLSSFAAEMKHIDAVIKAAKRDKKLLALIDEPARTTNPTEGAALVTALLKLLGGKQLSLVMTTHYDIEPGNAHCLRVKGFDNGVMDFALVEVQDGEVPHEALNIAQSLGIDAEWIRLARELLDIPKKNIHNK